MWKKNDRQTSYKQSRQPPPLIKYMNWGLAFTSQVAKKYWREYRKKKKTTEKVTSFVTNHFWEFNSLKRFGKSPDLATQSASFFFLFLHEATPVDRHDVSKPDCPTLARTGGHTINTALIGCRRINRAKCQAWSWISYIKRFTYWGIALPLFAHFFFKTQLLQGQWILIRSIPVVLPMSIWVQLLSQACQLRGSQRKPAKASSIIKIQSDRWPMFT